ncbi:MAG: tRNA (adenosine(37)-N6)-threonylcarbamoyltransferase complex ATPase subunit type 1 TsaE [Firmicutes bacterium]|nr:tRNA (adenosine(37)-N6)-threonylcarbamoyltransferase complex ATPase subunit type 1 TsaE [Candidatus Colimorpha enterica]
MAEMDFKCFVSQTHSVGETEKIGADFGRYLLEKGEKTAFIAMYGDLGAGKTAFIRGLSSSVTPGASVPSPTYTIVNEYDDGKNRLYHFDMYRIETEDDLESIGFYDYSDGMIAAEWCEKIPYALPETYYKVEIGKTGANDRTVTVRKTGDDDK